MAASTSLGENGVSLSLADSCVLAAAAIILHETKISSYFVSFITGNYNNIRSKIRASKPLLSVPCVLCDVRM